MLQNIVNQGYQKAHNKLYVLQKELFILCVPKKLIVGRK